MKPLALLLGRRLANRESAARKIGALEGVPAMGLDALASIAYGPEAALVLLMPVGAVAPALTGWLMLPIIILLGLLCLSYWQTIDAYRERGGAYVVARENLGVPAGLVAATALMIDYVLNVAVGISAGVGALISVLPRLHAHTVGICLAVLALLTLLNLRGTLDSGRTLAAPTYLFLACFIGMLALGVARALLAHGHPRPLQAPAPLATAAASGASLWLLLRAFASGCTAMTGVEAVSNGMGAFREPKSRNGHRTLGVIAGALALMLAAVAWLMPAYGVGAMAQARPGYRSVLAQLAGAIAGEGAFYYLTMATLLAVLVLSANTSFTAFPRLCRNLAQDGYLPESFAIAGRRLVYSIGLLCLAACAAVLLVAFAGITDRLIPLFAIGAFTGFALSQFGMAAHWRSAWRGHRTQGHAARLAFNAAGGAATTAALLVMMVAKFREGAWITLFLMAAGYALLHRIQRYYARLRRLEGDDATLRASAPARIAAIVIIERWNRPARAALEFAMGMTSEVFALHLARLTGPDQKEPADLRRRWNANVDAPLRAAGREPPHLRIAEARYRLLHRPILEWIADLRRENAGLRVAVVLPQQVKQHWLQQLLHAHRARSLHRHLTRANMPGLAIITVPWSPDK